MTLPRPPHLKLVRERSDSLATHQVERSDDELMLLVRAGQHVAFDALVLRHQARMLRVAHRFLGDSAAAADAVQNTFVALFGAVNSYQSRGKFRAYVYRLLLNQCRRAHRRGRLELRVRELLPAQPLTNDQLLERERQRDVERVLSRLPPKQRAVLLMRYTAELGYQEIAEALEIPLGTVKSRIFEATARLRELLQEP